MVKSRTALVLSALRWLRWFFQYAVVYPMATMMLLIVTALWCGHITPGQMLVNTIESVQREGYVIHDCTGPASREALNGDAVKPLLPPVLQEDCSSFSTDAAGYAAHIDQGYTKNIFWLWFLMAVVFTGVAVVFGRTPASRTGITWVRDARGDVFPGCRPGKGAISPLLAGYQKRGETIVIYDPSARFNEEDKNENKEK
ncbi:MULTISPECIES: conjugal transfer protein TraP [Enterobacteriaceae]|uniref:Conjugal transfer protein TraP n=1 Tax=Klebsiella michiganensis TaxID=1134687 RepID=A0AAJ1KW45_9ENTR|nr:MULTISPECIES: conjugal transfer protein TraP [Enterobacteriaceae]EKX1749139.1 TraP protein [Klebsiella oxytoca]MBZ7427483.1 TraP protein [Klebsiella michiganensis]MBZ7478661.1 TraP protein [Klebsiella michiganensis]MDH0965320.1 conjugal transfer protein TraP [Klebsiella michiganensis]MDI3170868.1 conjugal transfer protein TraP [Klebsiella michiganensis]